jgi:nitrate/nitrite transport system ATP-binding protein
VLAVGLPRPRSRLALASDAHYMRLRARVLEFLYDKQSKRAA